MPKHTNQWYNVIDPKAGRCYDLDCEFSGARRRRSEACQSNKNIIMSSFKSSRDIQKKEGGPDSCFG